MKLKDKIIIVTGSGRGIGRGIALRLAKDGATVIINDINKENANKVSKEIQAMGQKSMAIIGDVSIEKDVQNLVDKVVAEYGKLDVMIANAGIAVIKTTVDTTVAEWDKVFAVNVRGAFLCDTIAANQMIKQKYGKIINCASIAAHSGFAFLAAYS